MILPDNFIDLVEASLNNTNTDPNRRMLTDA